MLVLSRHRDESIRLGDEITITVLEIHGDKVRLGIEAPRELKVHRYEVYQAIQRKRTKLTVTQFDIDDDVVLYPSGGEVIARQALKALDAARAHDAAIIVYGHRTDLKRRDTLPSLLAAVLRLQTRHEVYDYFELATVELRAQMTPVVVALTTPNLVLGDVPGVMEVINCA